MGATSSRAFQSSHDNTELGEAEEALANSDVDLVGQDEQTVKVEADHVVERVLRGVGREGSNLDRPGTPKGKKRPQKSKKGKRGKQNQRRKSEDKDSTLKKGKGKKGTGRKGKTGKGKKGK